MATTRTTSKGSTHRFGGDWTDAKLDVLAKYLKSYTTALKGKPTPEQPFRKAYIDAFAGTGTRTARESESSGAPETLLFPDLAEAGPQKLLDGSAKLALQVEPRFDKYVFIERSPERCQQLEGLKTEFPALAGDIDVRQGEANEVIQKRRAGRPLELVEEPAVHVLLRGGQRAWQGHRAAHRESSTQDDHQGGALMALGSGIEWTESTWNPVTGCNKISPGCKYCYAERMAERLRAMGQPNYRNGFELTLQPQMLELPLQWRRPQTIFVNSMSDLFHKDVPLEYIQRVFDVMRRAHWHRFQVLTKRADRLAELSPEIEWPENVWMGVSVEKADYVDRVDDLRTTGACVKFLSLEPLLGPLKKLKLKDIDWVIVGGESGHRARPMDPAWVTDIRDQCAKADVAFFFKQWGGKNKKKAGRLLDGRTWDAMPTPPESAGTARAIAARALPIVA